MDDSLVARIKNQIFKFEAEFTNENDSCFTLDFERGRYREKELVGLVREAAKFFALTEEELKSLDISEHNRRSFTRISDANRNTKGDYGELLLYVILEIFFNVPKFVTKARLRSTTADQIKGFDCAHFSIDNKKSVILWLGEAKFYQDFLNAVNSALESLHEHLTNPERIKNELKLLGGEIEINKKLSSENYTILKNYVDGGRSLDSIPIVVPVLITYNSSSIKNFCGKNITIDDDLFKEKLLEELNTKFTTIYKKKWPAAPNIKIIFFLMPFQSVQDVKMNIEKVEEAMKF